MSSTRKKHTGTQERTLLIRINTMFIIITILILLLLVLYRMYIRGTILQLPPRIWSIISQLQIRDTSVIYIGSPCDHAKAPENWEMRQPTPCAELYISTSKACFEELL